MRVLLLAAAFATFPAHGDLYRWVDPSSGSVKYSSVAPPWQGEPGRPQVEVLTSAAPVAAKEKPADPGSKKPQQAEEAIVLEKFKQ